MNTDETRNLHRMLDRIAEGKTPSPEEIASLRKTLPELPKQKTLEEIAWDMDFAWSETYGNDWNDELFGDLEEWLKDRHTQLRAHLEGVKGQAHPALPAGMRLAKHENYGRVVVTDWIDSDNEHFCVYYSDVLERSSYVFLRESSLTFLDSKPAHPEFLETEADYQNAPFGTIAIHEDGYPWTRISGSWVAYSRNEYSSSEMAALRGKARVLCWGWGE